MNTRNSDHEQISAFIDGEIGDKEIDVALASLYGAKGNAAWDVYHRLSDALRSDELTISMSDDFTAKLMMRVEQEPAIVAPQVRDNVPIRKKLRRFLLPGMAAAAAAATVALVGAPQLMVASRVPSASDPQTIGAVSASSVLPVSAHVKIIATQQASMLRDPSLDEYLLAHQRFSPSVYSAAQYARSATFAADTNK